MIKSDCKTRKTVTVFLVLCLFSGTAQVAFSEETKSSTSEIREAKSSKGLKSVTGILADVTSGSITIRTEDGKELTYMRGFKLKLPKGVEKGSIVTIQVNEKLNVVKSIEHLAKHKG